MFAPARPFGPSNALAALTVAAALGLAACSGGATSPSPPPSATSSPPPPTTAAATSAAATSAAATSAAATSVPPTIPSPATTVPPGTTAASPSASPSPAGAPDPRTVPLATLARPDTTPVHAVYGDVDGDGVDDIALLQVAKRPPPGAVMPQQFLDVFTYDGSGWTRTWEATGPAPAGAAGTPASVLDLTEGAVPTQVVDYLQLADMAGDGTADLAVGVTNYGAGPGPLDVWVIGFGGAGPATEFWEETVGAGTLIGGGPTIRLRTGKYGPSDPACCPSRIENQTIGYDPGSGSIRVLHRTVTPAG